MPYFSAHLLDRCNEWLVAWRLRGREGTTDRARLEAYLEGLRSEVHPSLAELGSFTPHKGASRLWEAQSPWREAAGANRRWLSYHFPAVTAKADGAPPALIMLHGWLIDRLPLTVYRSWARRMARRGVDVWLPQMPHHLGRTEPGSVSGERFLSADLAASLDSIRQAVAEVRCLRSWLRGHGAPRVGIWGTSLGGWVGALAVALDADWDAVALWAPVASPTEVLWKSRLAHRMRAAVIDSGLSEGDAEGAALDLLTPESSPPRVRRERLLIVGAIHDSIVSPASVSRLARRWNVDVRWVPHGHIGLMVAPKVVRETAAFLAAGLVEPRR